MTKLQVIVHPVRKEFRRKRCGFDHDTPDVFVKSQWQTCTKSMAYLFYRWFMALFFIGVVIESMWPQADDETSYWLYFIYMTNWGIWMCMLTNLLGAILVTIWHYHPEYSDKLLNMEAWLSPFRIYWSMHIITLVLSIVITIIYWSILYDANESALDATNVLTHGFNSICMFIDLWIVAHPLRLLHAFLPVVFGVIYAIFSYIYQMCGGINKKGKPYIYHVIDWSQPKSAFITVLGVLVLSCCIYALLFVFFKLRLFLSRSCRQGSFVLPTTSSKQSGKAVDDKQTTQNGIQHSSSRISMVLGNYAGYENQAYSPSTGDPAPKN
ncbi:protein rolling stone [Drosophila sulfurigaster albostrigata]|uniref:protein rolling stone n=1 Tax=Drosophila sulfurigaster albostrigata TaxID=89887 RepID=UPI002D21B6C4|nr:protein rolling stone [Drosophila sulfurigaster albostrigata]XP_062127044.1 protein rolling stone [Drosophila sulfurigaster albostrigata]XP_062127051.1 protein rolling stone [Drosophila sulfurigaster albostrigata]XP_062127059.1 protein rolling stone [Drosophila sulfurigaster albostrigata]